MKDFQLCKYSVHLLVDIGAVTHTLPKLMKMLCKLYITEMFAEIPTCVQFMLRESLSNKWDIAWFGSDSLSINATKVGISKHLSNV